MGNMLGAARLSHSTDGSTSVERQSEQITATTTARGDKLIHITEDVDVSGAVSPFERDDLGPWLTDPGKIAQWDVLCVAKLDRLTRSIADFVKLVEWAKAHGKSIVSIGDSFDLSTPVGRMVAHILALFAQFERERMAERRADHTRKALAQARWDGRAVPPGYRPVKVGGHFELELDGAKAKRIRDMADGIIGGKSARQTGVTYDLDTSGVLSILRNPSLRGYVMHSPGKGKDGKPLPAEPVRGEDGLPVTREAVLDDETWARLQTVLDKNSSPGSGARKGAALLLGVAECWACGEPLYIQRRAAGDRYRHADGGDCTGSFTAAHLEGAVEGMLLTVAGDVQMIRRVAVPGKNHDAEIRRIEESIEQLDASFEAGDTTATTHGRMTARLEAKLDHLRSLPSTPDTVREIAAGKTYCEHWAELDTEARGRFLRDNGVVLRAARADERAARVPEIMAGLAERGDDRFGSVAVIGRAVVAVHLGDLYELCKAAARMAA